MEKGAKVYVAGHDGLVGSAIWRRLAARGFSPLVGRTLAELDLRDPRAAEAFLAAERPAYVFDAAARVGGIMANDTRPADFIYDNLMIQTNLLHAAWRAGVKKLLFLGSSCIYPRLAPQPIGEGSLLDGKLEPTNEAYAVAKIAGIVMCRSYNRQHGTDFIAVMPTNLYGPGDRFDLVDSHVLPAMIRKLHLARLVARGAWDGIARDLALFGNGPAAGEGGAALAAHLARFGVHPGRVVLWGTGSPRREFLHVDDLADACVFLMDRHSGSDIVNIGTGEDIAIRDLAALVGRVTGGGVAIEFDATSPDGTPRKLLDVSRLHALGWRHRIGLEEGVRATDAWYLERAGA